MSINRRTFLKSSLISGLAFSAPAILKAQNNRKYRTALIGSGWWGMNIARTAMQSGQCKMVAMCDADLNQLGPAAATNPESIKTSESFWTAKKLTSPSLPRPTTGIR